MSTKTKTKTINYRKASIDGLSSSNSDLQTIINRALSDQLVSIPITIRKDDEVKTLDLHQGELREYSGCSCSRITMYTVGKRVQVTDTGEDGSVFSEAVLPRDSKDVVRNHEEKFIVFAIKKNIIAYVSAHKNADRIIQEILDKIIASVIGKNQFLHVKLEPFIQNDVLDKIELGAAIKSVKFNDSVNGKIKPAKENTIHFSHKSTFRESLRNTVRSLMSSINPDDMTHAELELNGVDIGVELECNSFTTRDTRNMIAFLAKTANDNAKKTTITLTDGSVIQQGDLIVRGSFSIRQDTNEGENYELYMQRIATDLTDHVGDDKNS